KLSEFKHEIIKSTLEVVANLADKNSDARCDEGLCKKLRDEFMWRVRIELGGNRILLLAADCLDTFPQIGKVLVRPPYSCEGAIDAVRGVRHVPALGFRFLKPKRNGNTDYSD